jgi:hypothetical protein
MRVQLRDCNPPRAWKQSRGRGRYPHHFGVHAQRRFEQHTDTHNLATSDISAREGAVDVNHHAPSDSEEHVTHSEVILPSEEHSSTELVDHSPEPSQVRPVVSRQGSPEDSAGNDGSAPGEHYREWYDVDSQSPSLSSPKSSPLPMMGSGSSYPMPPGGYYSPAPPWMPPYPQQMPYPVPYYGYPVYPQGQQMPQPYPAMGNNASAMQPPWQYGVCLVSILCFEVTDVF